MKKQFTLAAIGLLAVTMLLFAGAFLTGRYDEPTDDNLGVERLSTPLSQLEGENAQQAPTLQPKQKPPTAEPADPLREPPQTSLDSTREVEVDFRRFRQLIPRDAINPIYRPRFTSAESAALNPEELALASHLWVGWLVVSRDPS